MNILIIGNGFDLAHGLETKYSDFLKFCRKIKFDELPQDNILRQLLEDNFWLSHFLLRSIDIGDTWIDFEDEILAAIIHLSRLINVNKLTYPRFFAFHNKNDSKTTYTFMGKRTDVQTVFYEDTGNVHSVVGCSHGLLDKDRANWKQQLKDLEKEVNEYIVFSDNSNLSQTNVLFGSRFGVVNYLYDELRRFVKALEYYLDLINNGKPKFTYTMKGETQFNSVISFNYTKTLERLYSDYAGKIVYLHGYIDEMGANPCNMVLGTRSFDNNDKIFCGFSTFQKFHQRQRYNNIREYQALLHHTDLVNKRGNVIRIIGHSLNSTDSFLINNILTASRDAQIIIYYHDESSKIRLIDNIYALLGEGDAERRTSFVYQHDQERRLLVPVETRLEG